jgi:hypothetical protein
MTDRWPTGEVLPGVWRFESIHPEWTEDADDWEPEVAWWAVRTDDGLVLIDPLVTDWDRLDRLVHENGGCAAIVRTTYWHERSIAQARDRYGAEVWARVGGVSSSNAPAPRFDRAVADRQLLPGGVQAFSVARDDEIALWIAPPAALVFGDVMLRGDDGTLRRCPDSWLVRDGGPALVRASLRSLQDLPVEHVLVAHGPLVLGDGRRALDAAISA